MQWPAGILKPLVTFEELKSAEFSPSPINWGRESIGQRVASMRKERGYKRVELAGKIGILQTLVADYENDRLRLTAETAVRFAMALDVSLDELLHPKVSKTAGRKASRMVPRRLEQFEALPGTQQALLPKTIELFLENAALKSARRA